MEKSTTTCPLCSREGRSDSRPIPDLLLRFAHCVLRHVVPRLAFVAADGAHVVVALHAAWDQEPGVGHGRWSITLQLAIGLGERPEPILQARQPLVHP